MKTSHLSNCIARAANFLDENQIYDGAFRSYMANNEAMQGRNALVDSSIFYTSCILYSLGFLDDPKLTTLKRAATEFLIKEMRPPGVWKYFSSGNPTPVDPDLDDIACASFVLRDIHPDIRAGRNVDIILGNRNGDGLFSTWLRKKDEPNDVDSVVNANVLLYLGDTDETRAVSEYLNAIIAECREAESYYYYLDDIALYYALSRAYCNGVTSLEPTKDTVILRILARQRRDGSFGNELLTALAVSCLLNYSCNHLDELSRGAESLVNTQQGDGSWPRRAYDVGPPPPSPHASWFGSEEVTTGFCVEALVRFRAFAAQK